MLTYEQTVLDLLKYALIKKGVSQNYYYLSNKEFPELPGGTGQGGCGLVKKDDKWLVYYFERSARYDFSLHDKISDAANDIFWKLTHPPSMYDFRDEWEKDTGLQIQRIFGDTATSALSSK